MQQIVSILLLTLIALLVISKRGAIKIVVVVALATTISLVTFYLWTKEEPPDIGYLRRVGGKVVEVHTRNARTRDIVFKVDSSSHLFGYFSWYPQFQGVSDQLQMGKRVAALVKPEDSSEGEVPVWMLSVEGQEIVGFQQLKEARSVNRHLALAISILFAFAAVGLCFKFAGKNKPFSLPERWRRIARIE